MKTFMFSLILLMGTQLFAQKRMSEESLKKMQQQEIASLELTDDQIPAYEEINQNFMQASKAVRQNDKDRKEMFSEMKKLSEERDEALKNLLSPEQYEKLEKMKEERMQKMRKNRRSRPSDNR